MKVVMSILFRVMHFPHNGNIMTIDQVSFVSPDLTVDHPTSRNLPYMKVISLSPHVNYVVLCPMPSTANEKDPLIECSTSLDSDLVVDMVSPSMWDLEHDLSPVTTIESLGIHSFQSIALPFDEDLLEATVKTHEHSSLFVSSSLKNETNNHDHSSLSVSRTLKYETDNYEHSSLSMSISLKNETNNHEHNSLSMSSSLKNETDPPLIELSLPLDLAPGASLPLFVSFDPLSSFLSGEPIPISSQESNWVQKKS
jgi:hypothetical protein